MKTQVECLPCLCRNAWDIAQRMTQDPFLRERIVKSAARTLSCCELRESPPEIAGGIIALANVLAHPESKEIKDIYREEKKRTAQLAATLVKMLPELPEYDEKDFESRLRLAVSGNIIDFGVFSSPTQEMALQALKSAFSKPVDVSAVRELEEAVKKVPGVTDATVSFMTQKLAIEADDTRFDAIMQDVVKACKKVEPDCEIYLK